MWAEIYLRMDNEVSKTGDSLETDLLTSHTNQIQHFRSVTSAVDHLIRANS